MERLNEKDGFLLKTFENDARAEMKLPGPARSLHINCQDQELWVCLCIKS